MEAGALEPVQAGDVGRARPAQLTGGSDQHVGLVLRASLQCQPPRAAVLVEGGGEHLRAEPDVPDHVEVPGDVAQVLMDLGLRGEAPRPVGLRRERQRVQVGRHVAGGTGIGVLPPDPADVVTLLEQHEVLDARLLEPHGGGEPAEAGTDDRDPGHAFLTQEVR
jgi:hypothetical protein